MRKLRVVAASVALSLSMSASAGGIPTIDITNVVQTTLTALNSFDQVRNQIQGIQNQIQGLQNMRDQLDQARADFENMTGSYDMSNLINSTSDIEGRVYAPSSYNDLVSIIDAGGVPSQQSQLQAYARDARDRGEDYVQSDIYPDTGTTQAQRYVRRGQEIFTSLGIASTSYEKTDQRLEDTQDLIASIDTATDSKAAADLGNRINAEVALLMTELIRLQSAQMAMVANQQSDMRNQQSSDVAKAMNSDVDLL